MENKVFNLIVINFKPGSRKRCLEEQNHADDDDADDDTYRYTIVLTTERKVGPPCNNAISNKVNIFRIASLKEKVMRKRGTHAE
jgi:hypothetical protein